MPKQLGLMPLLGLVPVSLPGISPVAVCATVDGFKRALVTLCD